MPRAYRLDWAYSCPVGQSPVLHLDYLGAHVLCRSIITHFAASSDAHMGSVHGGQVTAEVLLAVRRMHRAPPRASASVQGHGAVRQRACTPWADGQQKR